MVDQKYSYLTKKSGVYYYTRRVLKTLADSFGKDRIVKCLHTSSRQKAEQLSFELSSRLENIWDRIRLDLLDLAVYSFEFANNQQKRSAHSCDFRISDAFELYINLKAPLKAKGFENYTRRNQLSFLKSIKRTYEVNQRQWTLSCY